MKSLSEHCQAAYRDFSKKTLRNLAKKNIYIASITIIPSDISGYANTYTGYHINDNGCGKIRDHNEILKMAKEK